MNKLDMIIFYGNGEMFRISKFLARLFFGEMPQCHAPEQDNCRYKHAAKIAQEWIDKEKP